MSLIQPKITPSTTSNDLHLRFYRLNRLESAVSLTIALACILKQYTKNAIFYDVMTERLNELEKVKEKDYKQVSRCA
jgi:hypothetical protein